MTTKHGPRFTPWSPDAYKHWCNAGFGELMVPWERRDDPTFEPKHRYNCRLPKGHDGEHDCPANTGGPLPSNWVLYTCMVARPKVKPKGRSAAARAVFGGR